MLITYIRRIGFMTFSSDVFAMNETVVTIIYQVLILLPLESKHSNDLFISKLPQITYYYRLLMCFFLHSIISIIRFSFLRRHRKIVPEILYFRKIVWWSFFRGETEDVVVDQSVGKFHWFCWMNMWLLIESLK